MEQKDSPRFVIIFKPGPKWIPGETVFKQPLATHAHYMQMLYEQGKLLYAGPFLDDSGGLAIVKVASDSELRELIAREPATLDQIFVAEVHPWHLSFNADRGYL